ncbi:hypothetical protein MMC10_008075 [Thelotrema lepadinum]|nr:hypothetical protein [Thelotrema lepadinum]
MRYSLVFTSLVLSTTVLSNPIYIPGAERVSGTTQRLSSSNQAENYAANNGPQAQAELRKGKEVGQQVLAENPDIPEANVRAGKHSGGSQGADQVTLQVPAAGTQYAPPSKGPGTGSVAAHVTAQPGPGGREQVDQSKPVTTMPQPGATPPNVPNANQGKTASYNPAHPVPPTGPVKRDLGKLLEARITEEIMRRKLLRRELLQMQLSGHNSWVF